MKQDETTELIHLMFGVFHRMKEEMSFTSDLMHLSIVQIQTLIFLHHHENCTMSDIADYFHIELPSATSLINKLYEHKLITRFEDLKDRRLVRITLTEEGKTLVKKAMCERGKKLEKMLSYLKDKEKSDLLKILKTLYARLQK
jgi:MarR family transcriptional regulator, organic hydroperoxide resistance regulator